MSSKWEVFWRKISSSFHLIWRLLRYSYAPIVQYAFIALNQLANDLVHPALVALGRFFSTIPKFMNWREEKIKNAVEIAAALDLEALYWLYKASSATSVHRIIARCAFMDRNVTRRFEHDILDNFWRILEVNETNVVDFRHGLCVDLLSRECNYWSLLPCTPNVEFEGQLDKVEYQSYTRIAKNVINFNYVQIMKDAIKDDLKLPLAMWRCFFARASGDDTVAAYILTFEQNGLFEWKSDPTRESTHSTDPVSFQTVLKGITGSEPGKWKFDYLFRYFRHGSSDYSLDDKCFETHYLLLIAIYRNLTSHQPLIADKKQRGEFLSSLFHNFWTWLPHSNRRISPEDYFTFFKDILCVDAFWSESMTDYVRLTPVNCLGRIWESMDTGVTKHFSFMEWHDLTPVYQWCSRDLDQILLLYSLEITGTVGRKALNGLDPRVRVPVPAG